MCHSNLTNFTKISNVSKGTIANDFRSFFFNATSGTILATPIVLAEAVNFTISASEFIQAFAIVAFWTIFFQDTNSFVKTNLPSTSCTIAIINAEAFPSRLLENINNTDLGSLNETLARESTSRASKCLVISCN